MLRKLRKSSGRVTLVLIGVAALAGCSDETRRDVYATKEDCLADWANKPSDCTPATDSTHRSRGYWYGPSYVHNTGWGPSWGRSATTSRLSSRSIGSSSSSVSRGGFGSSGRSSGS